MVLYPIICAWLGSTAGDRRDAGGTIDDVAQVVGAGYAVSDAGRQRR